MKNKFLKTYLANDDDLRILKSTHLFAETSIWHKMGMANQIATFDLSIRDFSKRNFMIFAGLEELLNYLRKPFFSKKNLKFLIKTKVIFKELLPYFKKLKFTGNVYCLKEGTPFFPGEPIVRITAPLNEAALIENALINIICSNTPFLTKAVRCQIASDGKINLSTGPVRGHSFESGFKACRAGYIAGMSIPVTLAVPEKYKIKINKPFTNAQHLFIKSFPSELEAMRTMAKFFHNNCSFMVDTYDIKNGIANAIAVAKEMEKSGYKLGGIMIDSGDLVKWTKYARKELNKNNLNYVKISIATNLDEYKIKELIKQGVVCDLAGIITELLTLSDSPKTEAVYKIAELRNKNKITYTAKLTPGKMSLPGKKQIFRIYDKNGKMIRDVIGLENEKLGKPMLKKVMGDGKIIYKLPTLEEIRSYTKKNVSTLPKRLLDINKDQKYKVKVSSKIKKILKDLCKKHLGK